MHEVTVDIHRRGPIFRSSDGVIVEDLIIRHGSARASKELLHANGDTPCHIACAAGRRIGRKESRIELSDGRASGEDQLRLISRLRQKGHVRVQRASLQA
jgi:hypothetical protein